MMVLFLPQPIGTGLGIKTWDMTDSLTVMVNLLLAKILPPVPTILGSVGLDIFVFTEEMLSPEGTCCFH